MAKKAIPSEWSEVGRDGELILYVSPDREQGVLVDKRTGEPTGEPQPLQVFFKWGNFMEIQA